MPFPMLALPVLSLGGKKQEKGTPKSPRNVDEELWKLLLPSLLGASCEHQASSETANDRVSHRAGRAAKVTAGTQQNPAHPEGHYL